MKTHLKDVFYLPQFAAEVEQIKAAVKAKTTTRLGRDPKKVELKEACGAALGVYHVFFFRKQTAPMWNTSNERDRSSPFVMGVVKGETFQVQMLSRGYQLDGQDRVTLDKLKSELQKPGFRFYNNRRDEYECPGGLRLETVDAPLDMTPKSKVKVSK